MSSQVSSGDYYVSSRYIIYSKLIVPVGLFRDQKKRGTDYLKYSSLLMWKLGRNRNELIVSFPVVV